MTNLEVNIQEQHISDSAAFDPAELAACAKPYSRREPRHGSAIPKQFGNLEVRSKQRRLRQRGPLAPFITHPGSQTERSIMAPQPTCVQFKETRINFDWNSKGSIVNLEIPSAYSSSYSDSQNWSSSERVEDAEASFARENLATSSSIFFRPLNRYPRVVLWRITDNGRALSLHPVDFSRPSNIRGGTVEQSIKINFPGPIKENSVGLADGGNAVDELVVYVLLADKQIYTLRIKPEFWRSPAARKRIPDWCRSYLPSSFTLNNPHFLAAVDGRSCLVALQNGGLVRLAKGVNQVDGGLSAQTI